MAEQVSDMLDEGISYTSGLIYQRYSTSISDGSPVSMIRFSLIRSHLSLRLLPTTDSTSAGVIPLSTPSALFSLIARCFVQSTLGQKTFSRLPSVIASVQHAFRQGKQLFYQHDRVMWRGEPRTIHSHTLAFVYSFSLSDLPSKCHMRMPSFRSRTASDLHYTF